MLRDERASTSFASRFLRILRKEAAVPELPAAAHLIQVDAGQALPHDDCDDIDIDVCAGVGVLALG